MAGQLASIAATYCVVSATLSAGVCCFAKTFATRTNLLDKPDGVRKLHVDATPLIGGIALLIPSFLVSSVYLLAHYHEAHLLLAVVSAALVLIVGVIDDRTGISPVWRLLVMMFIIFTAFGLEPLFVLHTLCLGVPGSGICLSLDPFAMSVTVMIILGFANAANMADGMNGQLLGSVVIWCLFIAMHLSLGSAVPFLTVVCSALVTISFNLRGKLFSGSSGAYAASVFVALGAILAYRQSNGAMPAELPMLWFWLPVIDCIRLIVRRTSLGRSPLSGDRGHFHHMLHEGTRRRYALIIYLVLLAAPGVVGEIDVRAGSATFLVCFAAYIGIVVISRQDAKRPKATAVSSREAYFGASSVLQDSAASGVSQPGLQHGAQ